MNTFAALYEALDASTSTSDKTAALVGYFKDAPAADAAWAVAFLVGRRPKRLVKSADLRAFAGDAAGIPPWLFEACYEQAGDLAETIALLVADRATTATGGLAWWVEQRLLVLSSLVPAEQRSQLVETWSALGGSARFVFNKLLTGAFRVGVSEGLVVRALSQVSGVSTETVAHRLMGQWEPTADWYRQLIGADTADADWSRPYPFFLAHPLEAQPAALGDISDWQVEWKWDGIRCQLVRRKGRTFLWSRGEELLTGRFPEVEAVAEWLPDGTVLDGELLAWRDNAPLPFTELQRRINRKTVGRKLLTDVPCRLLVYDCLEAQGTDVRAESLLQRRARADVLVASLPSGTAIGLSPLLDVATWDDAVAKRARAREANAEGLMLKRSLAAYGVGRRGSDWFKWKVNPLTVDAVLVYAQAGHGRRAGLYTDYTFAIWDGEALVPFAKAYSGLTDAEIRQVDKFVRNNTLEKFGPVRTVKPELVFELAFEGIQRSTRHKSGIAVRFPRIARWRQDKPANEADSLETVRALLNA